MRRQLSVKHNWITVVSNACQSTNSFTKTVYVTEPTTVAALQIRFSLKLNYNINAIKGRISPFRTSSHLCSHFKSVISLNLESGSRVLKKLGDSRFLMTLRGINKELVRVVGILIIFIKLGLVFVVWYFH